MERFNSPETGVSEKCQETREPARREAGETWLVGRSIEAHREREFGGAVVSNGRYRVASFPLGILL
jgi:hypothetical protein